VIVKAKLFGTLSQNILGCQHSQEIEVEIPVRAKVKDLLAHLGIPESQKAVIIVEGRILKDDDLLEDGIFVNIMQAISGG